MNISLSLEEVKNIPDIIPDRYRIYFLLAIYTILIVIYSIIVWKFYRFLAKKDIFHFNLSQYNKSEHPFLRKFFAALLYLLEYILILPFIVSVWFVIFSIFLLLLSQQQSTLQILLVSAAMISATRIASYYNEELARDLAKMFPFTVLAVFLISPPYAFNLVNKIKEVPVLMNHILIFIIFIFAIEVFMRFVVFMNEIFSDKEDIETSSNS